MCCVETGTDERSEVLYYNWKPGAVVKAREQAYMSQEQLAKAAGVSTQTISRIERGETVRAQRRTVLRIARALDVHPNELTEEAEEEDEASERRPFPTRLATLA